ncbi:hypothetical protein NLJ89_g10326 [Agrocybe chaxingu]|uniref:Uncharacterized protein n=1 Tax=Agrocybe chaxingu TaxID=84603 RepID=A0A9W8JYX2_9AGAR|nr:hypothetical protein NLJ89_g10326 [Agrocybe chaxingu]
MSHTHHGSKGCDRTIYLPRLAPQLPLRQPTNITRNVRISRSSPLRGQGFPVGNLQVRIEDQPGALNEINPHAQLPTSSSCVQQLNEAPAHFSSHLQISPNASTTVSASSNRHAVQIFTALYNTSQEARATSAFYEYHRSNPNEAAALLGDLAGGTREEAKLMRFLLVSRGRDDWDAAMDLLDRMLRRELGMRPRPPEHVLPAYPFLVVAYLFVMFVLKGLLASWRILVSG